MNDLELEADELLARARRVWSPSPHDAARVLGATHGALGNPEPAPTATDPSATLPASGVAARLGAPAGKWLIGSLIVVSAVAGGFVWGRQVGRSEAVAAAVADASALLPQPAAAEGRRPDGEPERPEQGARAMAAAAAAEPGPIATEAPPTAAGAESRPAANATATEAMAAAAAADARPAAGAESRPAANPTAAAAEARPAAALSSHGTAVAAGSEPHTTHRTPAVDRRIPEGSGAPAGFDRAQPAADSDLTSLAAELRILRRVERALRDHKPARALRELSDLDRLVPNGQMLEERAAARAVARCTMQPSGEVARVFFAAHPGSVYAQRVLDACEPERTSP